MRPITKFWGLQSYWYIYVHSKADEMASLVYRTAQKRKNKEKIETKTE